MLNFNQWMQLNENSSNPESDNPIAEILKKFIINLKEHSSLYSPTYKIEKNKLLIDTSTPIEGNDEDTYNLDIEYWIILNITLNGDTRRLLELGLIQASDILKSIKVYESLTLSNESGLQIDSEKNELDIEIGEILNGNVDWLFDAIDQSIDDFSYRISNNQYFNDDDEDDDEDDEFF